MYGYLLAPSSLIRIEPGDGISGMKTTGVATSAGVGLVTANRTTRWVRH